MISNPQSSSGLGQYLFDAFQEADVSVTLHNPWESKWRKVWPVLRSWHPNPDIMWRRRWENMVYSSWAWDRNTRYNTSVVDQALAEGRKILLAGAASFPHRDYRDLEYYVFTQATMRIGLADGVTPWVPPQKDLPHYLERETAYYRSARHVFVGAEYVKESLCREYGVDEDRITNAGGGVHPDYLAACPESIPSEFTYQLIFVGWDFGMKGGADLLQAFALARKHVPQLRLLIVGPDANQQTAQEGVTWTGPLRSHKELISLYRQSDLFVMPSLRDSFGFVFLEAMSQGVPCIGADFHAMPEIIQEGKTGYLVPLRNPVAIADAIGRFYSDVKHRATMGQAARERVCETFTWQHVVERINAILWES